MSQHSSNQPGQLIGDRYRLEQQLGSGGMGEVYLATDTRLGKPVALKLLRSALAAAEDLDLRARLERECAICAALKSVHIVQVSDYGISSEGHPFYVMEYLQGQTLGQLLTSQLFLSVEHTRNIITQVCEGLQLAHSGVVIWDRETNSSQRIKVIHRDLKPDNIFLVPTALGELAKIIDFGIAKIHSLQSEYSSNTNVFLGTCHYASPEQFDPRGEVDERADIYSLGVILYEMLTGTDPFGFNFRQNRVTNSAWLSAHATQSPLPLTTQPDGQPIPAELAAIVMRCLAKSPADRFSSVSDLSAALKTLQSTFSPLNSPTLGNVRTTTPSSTPILQSSTPSTPSTPSSRRSKLPLLLGGSIALLLGIYAIPRLWTDSPVDNPFTAVLQRQHQFALAETLSANSMPVWATALSPDGQTLISGGEDRDSIERFYPIKIWDTETKQVQRTLEGHTAPIQSLSLSETGQLLASGSQDKQIKIWSLATGELLQTLTGHKDTVYSVALSPDGETLISGSADKTVRIWDLATGKSRVLSEHTGGVYSVVISSDQKTVASAGADKTIRLWNIATGELIRTLGEPGGHRNTVSAVAFSPTGEQLVSAGWDGFVKVWNTSSGQLLQTFEGHSDQVRSVAFIDPKTVVSGSADHTIKVWNTEAKQLLQSIPAHSDQVLSVTGVDQTLVSSSSDTTIKIWR